MLQSRKVKILDEKDLQKLILSIVHHIENKYTRTLDDEYQKIKETLIEVHYRGKKRAMPAGLACIGKQYEADLAIQKPTFDLYHEPEMSMQRIQEIMHMQKKEVISNSVDNEIQRVMDRYARLDDLQGLG